MNHLGRAAVAAESADTLKQPDHAREPYMKLLGALVVFVILLGSGYIVYLKQDVIDYFPIVLAVIFIFIFLIWTPYSVWRENIVRINEFEKAFDPRFELTFSGYIDTQLKDQSPGGRAEGREIPARYFRGSLINPNRDVINNVTPFITNVEKMDANGDFQPVGFQDSLPLGWSGVIGNASHAPSNLRHKIPKYFDIFDVNAECRGRDGHFYIPVRPLPLYLRNIFRDNGDYRLTVNVSGDNTATQTMTLVVHLEDNWQNTAMRRIDNG